MRAAEMTEMSTVEECTDAGDASYSEPADAPAAKCMYAADAAGKMPAAEMPATDMAAAEMTSANVPAANVRAASVAAATMSAATTATVAASETAGEGGLRRQV